MASSSVRDVTAEPMRRRLTDAVARLVAAGGAAMLSARRVASEAGTSTMAVYTHFGSMEALMAAVVEEGFGRLEHRFLALEPSDDPIEDLARYTEAYVEYAQDNPELYAVMFGVAPLGAFRPVTPEQLAVGRRETLDRVASTLSRGVEAGRLRDAGGSALSFRWWAIVHGYALLEGAGYIGAEHGRGRVLAPLLVDFLIGEGDDGSRAMDSVRHVLG